MLTKKQSPKIDAAVQRSVDFETTVSDLAQRSERRAWMVAFCAISMALMLAGGYLYILPLKEKVPYIVLADAYTGMSSLTRITDDVVNRRITASEAINRSNITHFILARESFDVTMINLRDWATVLTMASPNIARAYTDLHALDNPNAPYKTYGRDRSVRVKILSIVLINSDDGTPKGATVRFQRSVFNKTTGLTVPLDSKIATMAFAYKPNLKMDDQYRVENPLGFQVTDYRVDNDYAEPPPQPVEAAAPATQAPAQATPPAATTAAATTVPASPIPLDAPTVQTAPAQAAAPTNAANGGRR
ncbi:type IV secretion system protein VirB8 [Luteibacter sp. UNCMF331Sha3.1]|uniref:virB8 family protein n=1 Tax=Luteibacter sp. UNCMF331Sha3.1 TaxID=1502760 RepID=UPI0008B4370C|nr:type IV secretion system protein [Luteibacter sp. UNCMF331Sha3.1]SEM96053.1 type IV secretion system protein VirB8 [Luteibacter sp. UNCMF331Sha3.1]